MASSTPTKGNTTSVKSTESAQSAKSVRSAVASKSTVEPSEGGAADSTTPANPSGKSGAKKHKAGTEVASVASASSVAKSRALDGEADAQRSTKQLTKQSTKSGTTKQASSVESGGATSTKSDVKGATSTIGAATKTSSKASPKASPTTTKSSASASVADRRGKTAATIDATRSAPTAKSATKVRASAAASTTGASTSKSATTTVSTKSTPSQNINQMSNAAASASTANQLDATAKKGAAQSNVAAKVATSSKTARVSHDTISARENRSDFSGKPQSPAKPRQRSGAGADNHRRQLDNRNRPLQSRGIRIGDSKMDQGAGGRYSRNDARAGGSTSSSSARPDILSKKRDMTAGASDKSRSVNNRYNRTYSAGGVSGKGNYRSGGNEGGQLKFKQDSRFGRRTDNDSSGFSRANRSEQYAKSGGARTGGGNNNRRGNGKPPFEKSGGGFSGNRNRSNGPAGTLLKKGAMVPKFGGRKNDAIKSNRPWNRFDTNRDGENRDGRARARGDRWSDSRGDRGNAFSTDQRRRSQFYGRQSTPGKMGQGTPGDIPFDQQRQSQSDWHKNREQKVKHDRDRYDSNDFGAEIEMPLSPAAHKTAPLANPIPKSISITEAISVSDLAKKLNIKGVDLVSKLVSLGIMASINNVLDSDTATLIAEEYGAKVNIISLYDETKLVQAVSEDCKPQRRPPVVTVMGHVDHGKTTLLDTIRKSNVVAGESGGITQHIAAYQVASKGEKITFIDTPGHAAFTMMRARGAQITDIVVLVVSADDGIMPQTKEAIDHAQAAKVPIIVAINKIDLANSNVEQTKKQLSDVGLIAEEWGGEVIICPVSALKGDGISELLEAILVASHEMDCTALVDKAAVGRVLESRIDQGRGIVCSVLIQEGTLRNGDFFLAGTNTGKVRGIYDDRGNKLSVAYPSAPVEIIGFSDIPNAGDPFEVAADEREAKSISSKRKELSKVELAREMKPLDVEGVYHTIEQQHFKISKVIVKGDVDGSVEAIKASLDNLQNDQVRLEVIHTAAGEVNENDVLLARASHAMIICFNIKPSARIQKFADQHEIEIRKYNVIYNMIDDMKRYISGMRESEYKEVQIGGCEVRAIFSSSKNEHIIGAYVNKGKVKINAPVEVMRKDTPLFKSTIMSLKRFKKNVSSVETGYECGIVLDNDTTVQEGDIIKVFESVLVEQSSDSE